jgi:hypothetical protein
MPRPWRRIAERLRVELESEVDEETKELVVELQDGSGSGSSLESRA